MLGGISIMCARRHWSMLAVSAGCWQTHTGKSPRCEEPMCDGWALSDYATEFHAFLIRFLCTLTCIEYAFLLGFQR